MRKKLPLHLCLLCWVLGATAQPESSANLPVRLSSLEGNIQQSVVTLHWTTVCFLTFAHFDIQRSTDGKTFETITTFAADAVRCRQPFEIKDTLHSGTTAYYKVNVGDADGKFYHSRIISIANRAASGKVVSAYPTVVQSVVNMAVDIPADQTAHLQLLTSQGALIKQRAVALQKGRSFVSMDMGTVPAGTYWLMLVYANGEKHSVAVVKN